MHRFVRCSDVSAPDSIMVTCVDTMFDIRLNIAEMCLLIQDFDECMKAIESQLEACNGAAEYPIYVKALIKRQQGMLTRVWHSLVCNIRHVS